MVHIPPGRRGAVLAAASAAVVCLGTLAIFGPGGGTDPGYIAVGPAGPSPGVTANVPPGGSVDLVPLDGGKSGNGEDGEDGSTATSTGRPRAPASATAPDGSGADGGPSTGPAVATGSAGSSTAPGPPSATTGPGPGSPAASGPASAARLTVSAPKRAASGVRWCEYVTVTFTNTGGRTATSGTVTFGTHIIGVLGIDWATVETDRPVPVPVKGGAKKERTWEICVDAWRVPLGMHIETQDVSLDP